MKAETLMRSPPVENVKSEPDNRGNMEANANYSFFLHFQSTFHNEYHSIFIEMDGGRVL